MLDYYGFIFFVELMFDFELNNNGFIFYIFILLTLIICFMILIYQYSLYRF